MPPPAAARAVGAGTSSDRRQSTRQGRTTVRPTNYYARTFAGRLAANGMEQTPEAASGGSGFCPALTHFTQAVDAFPKELIRHFSMFKEVEAKIHDPEHMLRLLLDEVAQMPVPTKAQRRDVIPNGNAADHSVAANVNGSAPHDPTAHPGGLPPDEQADLQRRQVFFRLRMLIVNLLPTLDEKLVVLGGAIASKDRGLARMNNSYVHLDSEISEEARYGSLTHWAYADKEEKKKGGASHERQRREVVSANNLAAAAQHVHEADSIAAKSEARREAMLANKRNRHHHNDSDFDDRPVKKPQKRKAVAPDPAADSRNIGLGITSNGASSQGKRKKTEKALAAAAAAAPPMERSLSGALKPAPGGRSGTSPRATPGVDAGAAGKRKPRAVPAQTQRKYPLPQNSPPPSSPLTGNFTLPKATVSATDRPVPSRARNNSIAHSVTSNAAEPSIARRPSSSHSVQQAPSSNAITELEQAAGVNHENVSKEPSPPKDSTELPPFETLTTATLKHEEADTQEPVRMEIDIPAPTPVTTRAGRTSKTATPIVGTFAEVPMARSRSTRKANNGNGNSNASSENNSTTTGIVSKRLPKKATQAGGAHSPALPTMDQKSNPHSSRASSIAPEQDSQDADSEEDGDEPRYCYCNQVSYGNMIACDNESCAREWFHLPCVNLDRAPSGRKKWFCSDECKDAYAEGKTARSGRPGSSRQ